MSYRHRARTQGIFKELGRGIGEFNKGLRDTRRWMFRRKKTVNRIPPPNNNLMGYNRGIKFEKKCKDSGSTYTVTTLNDTISTVLINGIAEGTGIDQRTGRKLQMSTFSIKYWVTSAADYSANSCRIMLIYDKQNNGTTLTASDIFKQSSNPADSFLELKNRNRFVVLKDKRFASNPTDSAKTSTIDGSFGVNLRNLETTYGNTGSAITDITTGALHLLLCSSATTGGGGTNSPTMAHMWRMRYYDA